MAPVSKMATQAVGWAAAAALGLGALALPGLAVAAPVTLNFAGQVSQTSFDPFDPFSGAVHAGTPMSSYLNIDTSTADSAPASDFGSYTWSGGTFGLGVLMGAVMFPTLRSVNISIIDGSPGAFDQYLMYAWEGVAGGLADFFSMTMLLQDDTGTALNSDALPTGVPDLGRFAIRTFTASGQYTDVNGDFIQYEVQGNLVSEPGSVVLVGIALAACLWRPHRAVRARPNP